MGIEAGAPLFTSWPEQEIRMVSKEASPQVKRVEFKKIGDGALHMVISVPRLPRGESAQAIVTLEVAKREILAPAAPQLLTLPGRPGAELRAHLGPSPLIESSHPEITALSQQIVAGKATGWEKAEAIYDWVQANVRYENGPLKGALAALREGKGDCEEMTSLFIALCRAQSIPARTVWVPGHCYPEFYLEDGTGVGHWLPCQAAGDRQFGEMREARPIFQKGDSFQVPGHREKSHYAHAWLTSKGRPGQAPPQVEVIVRRVDDKAAAAP
jgi:transglutaminase-like putative cysteine protease